MIRASCVLRRQWPIALCAQWRGLASNQRPPDSFIGRLVENVRSELRKSGAIKDNVKKLQEEAQSEKVEKIKGALRSGSAKVGGVASTVFDQTKSQASKVFDRVRQTGVFDSVKKSGVAEGLRKTGEGIRKTGDSRVVKEISKGVGAVRDELVGDGEKLSRPYEAPKEKRRRVPQADGRTIKEDTETTGIKLHKDAKIYAQWEKFKNTNPVINGLFDLKRRYDESDSLAVRSLRALTDRISGIFVGMTTPSETSKVLEEILKVDQSFDQEKFLKECQLEIVPTILEAFLSGDEELLREWCHDAAFGVLSTLIAQQKQLGLRSECRILDLSTVELLAGKMMEHGPVLIISFQTQQLTLLRNQQGEIVEGGEDHIEKYQYVWALCRDQTIFDPRSAWRVLEFAISSSNDQLV